MALDGSPDAVVTLSGGDDARTVLLDEDGHAEVLGLLGDTRYTFEADGSSLLVTLPGPTAPYCPTVDVLVNEIDRRGPGWLLVPHRPLDLDRSCTIVYDEQLRPRWWFLAEGWSAEDAVFGPDGNVWLRTSSDEVEVVTRQGERVAHYSANPEPGELPLPLGPDGHELVPNADGSFWAFGQYARRFEVPVEIGSDASRMAQVDNTPVQLVSPEGELLRSIEPLDAMQPGRCGFDCLLPWPYGLDFLHGNAFVPLPDGRVLVGLRNQDVLVMFEADGSVAWRMGDPLGWDPPWRDEFLASEGAITWPYHHHGVDFDPETGALLVFDNHTWGGSPWAFDPEDVEARVALYRVDEAAGTVRQEASFSETTTGPLKSSIMGDADLPATPGDPILSVFSWVRAEGEVTNVSRGWGGLTSRVVEFDPEDPANPPLDLRFRLPAAVFPDGGYVYRVHHQAPLDVQ